MTKLKVGSQQAVIVQDFQTLAYIASQVLGGSTNRETVSENDPSVMRPQNAQQLQAAMNKVFGNGG